MSVGILTNHSDGPTYSSKNSARVGQSLDIQKYPFEVFEKFDVIPSCVRGKTVCILGATEVVVDLCSRNP